MSELPLAAAGFDRAGERRGDDDWLAAAWQRAKILVVTPKSATPVTAQATLAFRDAASAPADAPRRFLGVVEDQPYFAVTAQPDDGSWLTLRELGAALDDVEVGLLTTAIALEQWHQRHPRCPRCGAATVEASAGWIRRCPDDASEHFPRTDPAVIMLVHDGAGHALLGQGVNWGAGRYSTLAGFVEPGESLEAAVVREVREEVGVAVSDVHYVASQPWPFPSSLMLGFSARLAGARELTVDPKEVVTAGWFTRDEVSRAADWVDTGAEADAAARVLFIPPRLSISRYLIDRWLDGTLP